MIIVELTRIKCIGNYLKDCKLQKYQKMVKRILLSFLMFYCCLTYSVIAQNYAIIDSVKKDLNSSDLKLKFKTYNKIAWEFRKSNPDSTIFYGQKSLEIATDPEMNKFIAQPLNFLGVGHYYKGENLEAYDYYTKAKDAALINGDSLQYGYSLNNIGRIYFNQGDYIPAYNNFFRALEIFEAINNKPAISYCYKSLAEVYQTQNNLEKALEMSLKTEEIRKDFKDHSGIISINLEIAGIYAEMQNYDNALNYFNKAYKIAEKINDEANLAITKIGITVMDTERGELDKALSNAKEALKFAEKSKNFNLLNKVYYQLGLIYYLKNDLINALNYFKEVEERASENNDITYERDAFLYMSRILDNHGLTKKAFDYFKLHTELKARTDNAHTAREIEKLESRVEIEVKEKENQMLKLNEEIYKEVIKKQSSFNKALMIIAILVFLLLVIIGLTASKRRKYNKKLLRQNKQIEEHQKKITAKNNEIKQQNNMLIIHNKDLDELNNEKDSLLNIVAHDLKSPFNRIIGLADLLRLSGLSQEQGQYVQMIKTNSKHGTYLINDLLDVNAIEIDKEKPVPSPIDLKTLLEDKATDFIVELTNKEMECNIECEPNQVIISDKTDLNRILDNLISNAIKFSELGAEIILRAGKSDKGFWVVIKDFGQGFTNKDQKDIFKKFKKLSAKPTGGEGSNGLGLAIVKTLVDRLDGKIILNSEKDNYSEFTIFFPMHEK